MRMDRASSIWTITPRKFGTRLHHGGHRRVAINEMHQNGYVPAPTRSSAPGLLRTIWLRKPKPNRERRGYTSAGKRKPTHRSRTRTASRTTASRHCAANDHEMRILRLFEPWIRRANSICRCVSVLSKIARSCAPDSVPASRQTGPPPRSTIRLWPKIASRASAGVRRRVLETWACWWRR